MDVPPPSVARRDSRLHGYSSVSSKCKKIAFASKRDAKRYIKAKRKAPGFKAKHVYKCSVKGEPEHWHTTSRTAGA